jgi:VIT1/CCC1 family predicted Fe2+/Mn2+ transporter
MMMEELGLPPPDKDSLGPVKAGLITMTSFMIFGSIPLLPYLIALIPYTDAVLTEAVQLYASVVTTVLTLFILGVVKGRVSGGVKSWWWSGVQMAMNGSFAAVLGFIVGWGMGKLVRADEVVPPGAD